MIASLTRKPQFSYYTAEEQRSSVRVWFGWSGARKHTQCRQRHLCPAKSSRFSSLSVMLRVTAGSTRYELPGPGSPPSCEMLLRTAGSLGITLKHWLLSTSQISVFTRSVLFATIFYSFSDRGWQWVRWDLHRGHVSPAPTLCPPTRSRVLRLSSSPRMIASLADIPRLALSHPTSHRLR